jgi:tryptophan 2,3-dioxygenase
MSDGLYYWDYLGLDEVLDAQHLESERAGRPAHDEMLFIVIHQAYELWFKQILWELDAVDVTMRQAHIAERDLAQVVQRLERITEIQRVLLAQLPVLETMTPLDFLDFREYLVPASGFQSVQFRLIENKLGIDPDHRPLINQQPYTVVLSDEHAELIKRTAEEPSLLSHVEHWLERTPFVQWGAFDFWSEYRSTVDAMLDREARIIRDNPSLDEEGRAEQLAQHDTTVTTFMTVFDRDRYEELRAKGERQLTHGAFIAALLITLYRDEPAFQMPHRLLNALVDIDEGFTAWRYRHALMVHRMIGSKIGTGGTSGHRYLQKAAERNKAFRDLYDLATYCIPRHQLPELPPEVARQLGFRFHTDEQDTIDATDADGS